MNEKGCAVVSDEAKSNAERMRVGVGVGNAERGGEVCLYERVMSDE